VLRAVRAEKRVHRDASHRPATTLRTADPDP
jgi:hypothetical protein